MKNQAYLPFVALATLFLWLLLSSCDRKPSQTANEGGIDPSTLAFKRTDNTLHLNLAAEPRSLNPLLTVQGYDRYVHEQILQSLNGQDPITFQPVPLLAGLPEVLPNDQNGMDYVYDIQEGATWPNGSPVTAADVVFTLKVLFNPLVNAAPYRPYFDMISRVVLSPGNERRVKIETKQAYILSQAAIGSLQIYPAYAYDPEGLLQNIPLSDLLDPSTAQSLAETDENLRTFAEQFNDAAWGRDPDKVIGSGPYQLASWEAGQSIRLEKRPDYWAKNSKESLLQAGPDAIVYNFIRDGVTVANAIRSQELDAAAEIETALFQEMRTESSTSDFYELPTVSGYKYYSLLLNTQDPKLADKRTRRALAHLIDVDNIIENLYAGMAQRITGPILPQKDYYNQNLQPLPYAPETAASLLEAAGWRDSNGNGILDKDIEGTVQELELEIMSFSSEISKNIALLLQESAATIGVKMSISLLEPKVLVGRLNSGDYHIATMGAGSDPGLDDLTQVWSTKSVPPAGTNRTRFGNAKSDQLISQIRTTLNEKERHALYQEIQAMIYDEQPMIFLFAPDERMALSKRFKAEPTSIAPGYKANSFLQQDWNLQ